MSGKKAVRPDEIEAARIVSAVLGGRATPLDVCGAPDLTPDWEIELPTGEKIILEVTSGADPVVVRQGVHAHGRVYAVSSLAHDWWLVLPIPQGGSAVRVKEVAVKAEPLLAVFEAHGVTQVGNVAFPRAPSGTDPSIVDAGRRLFDLGVMSANQLREPEPGTSALLLFSLSGGEPVEVNDLVAAQAKSDASKLAAASGSQKHLFVWIEGSTPSAELAVSKGTPPSTTPTLPVATDVAWVATWDPAAEGDVGGPWRVRPPAAWEAVDRSVLVLAGGNLVS